MDKWRKILAIHGVREILMLFNTVFLGIYFLKLTNGSIETVAIYYLIYYTSHVVWRYIVSKIISNKNIVKIYRLSMFINLSVSIVIVLLGANIVQWINIFATYYALSQSLYWSTYEVMIFEFNDKENFKRYFSYDSIIANISAIIFPVLFGLMLDKFSYNIVFIILSLIALISFILSFTIKDIEIKCQKINLKESFKNIKNKKILKYAGLQSIVDGLTNGGVIQMLTVLIIFSKYQNEAFMGIVASIIGAACILTGLFTKKKINRNNFFKVVFSITFCLFLVTIPISFNTTIILVIVYKLLIEICDVLTNVEGNTVAFEACDIALEPKYKIDYQWYMELTLATGRALGLIAIIIICKLTNTNITALTILFIYFTVFYMLRTIIIQKIRKLEQIIVREE